MNGMEEFWAMGGYAAFVWSSYAIALGGLAALAGLSFARTRRMRAAVTALRDQRREPGA